MTVRVCATQQTLPHLLPPLRFAPPPLSGADNEMAAWEQRQRPAPALRLGTRGKPRSLLAFAASHAATFRRCIPQRLAPRPLLTAKGERGARLKSCRGMGCPAFNHIPLIAGEARKGSPKSDAHQPLPSDQRRIGELCHF